MRNTRAAKRSWKDRREAVGEGGVATIPGRGLEQRSG